MLLQEDVVNEARTMALHHHPNLLPLLASFTDGDQLWIVEPFIEHGSVLNILKYSNRNGLSEELIAIIVYETLKGLDYLHRHQMMHRDVKAGNILVDATGHVYLADFGVAAPLEQRGGSWGEKPRNTFVGTPCWMAPEVMQV
jgi:serine/threonine-protein kinase OSR1/STK39